MRRKQQRQRLRQQQRSSNALGPLVLESRQLTVSKLAAEEELIAEDVELIDAEAGELADFDGGAEAQRFLIEDVGLAPAAVAALAERFAPLRGEMWYRRRNGKKVLDVYFLEDTLPDLVELLEAPEELGWSQEEMAAAFAVVPSLLGREAAEVAASLRYVREEVGLEGGELRGALSACPSLLLYDARTNLRAKHAYLTRHLGLTPAQLRELMLKYPRMFDVAFTGEGKSSIASLDVLLDSGMTTHMACQLVVAEPELVAEAKGKRVKALMHYLQKWRRLRGKRVKALMHYLQKWLRPRGKRDKALMHCVQKVLKLEPEVATRLVCSHPRLLGMEAEKDLAPLRHFFEYDLCITDTRRIGSIVAKLPQILFMDLETELRPKAADIRAKLGIPDDAAPPRPRAPRPTRAEQRAMGPRRPTSAAGGRGTFGGQGRGGGRGAGMGVGGRGTGVMRRIERDEE
ncbi:hypothetical protein JKP88DRAFT_328948 [Tribonema minus]|uniref:Uncharacterized protein n=1 Tax=Tribonema minus TaxID=303371 RepID=A0A835YN67_9STRA|nr:hypothetical protein JKP88DRAFT_328948 [Tribonema minus]